MTFAETADNIVARSTRTDAKTVTAYIHELRAEGLGLTRIARALDDLGIVASRTTIKSWEARTDV